MLNRGGEVGSMVLNRGGEVGPDVDQIWWG